MVEFTVYGTPQPQGSSKAFVHTNKVTGVQRAIVTGANAKNKSWRQEVSTAAMIAMHGFTRIERPAAVRLVATFWFAKPQSQKKAIVFKTTKPDTDKLTRSIFDALSGICFDDDAQVASSLIEKKFGLPERVEICVQRSLL